MQAWEEWIDRTRTKAVLCCEKVAEHKCSGPFCTTPAPMGTAWSAKIVDKCRFARSKPGKLVRYCNRRARLYAQSTIPERKRSIR